MAQSSRQPVSSPIAASPHPPPVAVVNGHPLYQYQDSYKPRANTRSCGRVWCISTIILSLIFIVVIVLIPLFLTGVISFKKPEVVTRRSTYDPFYYGNLHPYLYPGEKESMGIKTDYDVIVVGAGIAGLAAANALMQEGLNVVVLEARVSLTSNI